MNRRENLVSKENRKWENWFSGGFLVDCLEGKPEFACTRDRNASASKNLRYEQDRLHVFHKLFSLSEKNNWNLCELIVSSLNDLERKDNYALLVSLDALLIILVSDLKHGCVYPKTIIRNLGTLFTILFNRLKEVELVDFQLDGYFESLVNQQRIKSIEATKSSVGENIQYIISANANVKV